MMPESTAAERRPIMGLWQTRGLIELMDRFYSDPKNQAAYEKRKAERDRQGTKGGRDCE
jgi:hypothetical protein